ncbi:MAG TPA: RHS repeat domain-containing protein, partial [Pirellulales bacterium]
MCYGALDTLVYTAGTYVLTKPDGTQETYAGFGSGTQARLLKRTAPGGLELVVSYSADLPTLAKRTAISGDAESFVYNYFTSGDNAGRLSSVTLVRQPIGGTAFNVRRATYSYYDSGDLNGSIGDLKTAVQQVYNASTWQTLGTCYYRYWTGTGGGPGFAHGLKSVFQPASYAALYAAHGSPESLSDATVARYADNYFEYDSYDRVTREDVNGGQYTHLLSYSVNPIGDDSDPNSWISMTTDQLLDGSTLLVQNIVYTNSIGQVLLKDTSNPSGQHWLDYQEFDENNNLVLHALPSAVAGYDADTLEVTLQSDSGLIQSYEYDPDGNLQFEYAQHGTDGDSVTVASYTYDTSGPVVQLATSTDALGVTTSYSYAYHAGTSQLSEKVTTLPVVDPSHNGRGATVTQREIYDTYGNMNWERGPRGFIDYFNYDVTTGARVVQIEDVNDSLLSMPTDFVDDLGLWTTPEGGGAHLETDYTVDSQGRTIQTLGPTHDVNLSVDDGFESYSVRTAMWTIYQDAINEIWTSGGYARASGGGYAYTLVNPVTIQQFDDDGRLLATIQANEADISGPLSASYTFPQSSYFAWTTQVYDDSGDLTATRVYKLIPTSGSGTSGTNYDQTSYGYTALGLQNMVRSPGGTITRTVYDALNRVVSVYVGTNDTGATDEDPTGGRANGNSMVCTQTNVYDGGGVGDSNVTQSTVYVDSTGTNNRVTSYSYDWRDRQTSISGPLGFYQENTYDDLNRVIQTDQRNTNASGTLLARSQTQYDELGRVYQKLRWEVDPTTGAVGNSLVDNTWYDEAGNVIKSQPSGSQAFTKTSYDGLGRQIAQYTGYFATSGVDDYTAVDETNKIFEQTYTIYDGAGDVLQVTSYQRLHNNYWSFGPLTSSDARVTYTAFWYDSANRRMFSANYGTNGGTAPTRPDVAPDSSDTVLVSTTTYGPANNPFQSVDPAGMVTRRVFDARLRILELINNYIDGSDAPDANNSVLTGYSPDGQVATLTAINPTTGNQTTTYTYGTTLSDSAVARADLLRSVTYPDGGVVSYTYNRQGQVTQMTDQNGTLHQYTYDLLGRPTADSVITLGTGIDDAVRRIARTYNTVGLPQNVTSYSAVTGGTVVNDIFYRYNGFQQLTAEYQSHSGAVNTSSTPAVQYSYADGSQNTVRLTEITYPSGNGPSYEYAGIYSDDDMLSRVTQIMDSSGPVVDYVYLGLKTFVQVEYPDPGIRYDLAFGSGSGLYAGLDNFGRVIDCRWRKVSTGSDVERIQYGYDQASNRTWRHNTVAPAGNDEFYTYDGLHRLDNFQRGTFSGSDRTTITSQTLGQSWTLDATGNWSAFANTDALVPANDLSQTRTHTEANEIATFAASSGAVWAAPHYDAAGNMTAFPQPNSPTSAFSAAYDAWNRQVGITGTAAYTYDGVNRR